MDVISVLLRRHDQLSVVSFGIGLGEVDHQVF